MDSFLAQNFLSIILSAVVGLLLYAFKGLIRRIEQLEADEKACPIKTIDGAIAEIKTDIKWIKGRLFNKAAND